MVLPDSVMKELERVLPKDHHFFDKIEEMERPREEGDLANAASSLVDIIEDWKRDIRDWKEVEDVLDQTRAELTLYIHKETA